MGDLPRERRKKEKKNDGLIMMGDLPKERWSHYDGWPTQMKDEKRSHCNGWPTQMERKMVSLLGVTYPDGKWKVVSL